MVLVEVDNAQLSLLSLFSYFGDGLLKPGVIVLLCFELHLFKSLDTGQTRIHLQQFVLLLFSNIVAAQ